MLTFFTYLYAAFFAALGAAFAFGANECKASFFAFTRSSKAAVVTFGGSGLWFLYLLSQLGEADFGNIKWFLVAIFCGAGIAAFKYLSDFLSVRGAAITALLTSRFALDSAYMQPCQSRLVLVCACYLLVALALYYGAVPYRMRDNLEFLYAKPVRTKRFGMLLLAVALMLAIAPVFY